MGNKKKIGVRVDEDVYERFVSFVEDTHGRTHGVIGSELESALLNYMNGDEGDALRRIEEDVSSINAGVADLVQRIDRIERQAEGVEADGGGGTLSNARTHTHTTDVDEDDTFDEPPGPKAPKSTKVEYLFDDFDLPADAMVTRVAAIRKKIDKTWSFGDRATEDLVERFFDKYHAKAVRIGVYGDFEYVAIGKTIDDRDAAIDDFADGHDEEISIAQENDEHVEGADVFGVVDA